MDSNMRRGHDEAFKARVALEALKGDVYCRSNNIPYHNAAITRGIAQGLSELQKESITCKKK